MMVGAVPPTAEQTIQAQMLILIKSQISHLPLLSQPIPINQINLQMIRLQQIIRMLDMKQYPMLQGALTGQQKWMEKLILFRRVSSLRITVNHMWQLQLSAS